jgi:hypothetical protein
LVVHRCRDHAEIHGRDRHRVVSLLGQGSSHEHLLLYSLPVICSLERVQGMHRSILLTVYTRWLRLQACIHIQNILFLTDGARRMTTSRWF